MKMTFFQWVLTLCGGAALAFYVLQAAIVGLFIFFKTFHFLGASFYALFI